MSSTVLLALMSVLAALSAAFPSAFRVAHRLLRDAPAVVLASIAFAWTFLDIFGTLAQQPALRYLGTAVCWVTALLLVRDVRVRNMLTPIAVFAGLLASYIIVGAFLGRYTGMQRNGALPFGLPLMLVAIPIVQRFSRWGARVALWVLWTVGVVTCLGMAALRVGFLPVQSLLVFSHERSFIAVCGVLAALALRRWVAGLIGAAAFVLAVATYPAATMALAVLVGLPVFWLLSSRVSRGAVALLLVGTTIAPFVVVNFYDQLLRVWAPYFVRVGKLDNGALRQLMASRAMDQISSSPWFGSGFTGDATVVVSRQLGASMVLPVHNDYITITLGGGYIAMVLLVGVIGASLRLGGNAATSFAPRTPERGLAAVLTAAVATASVTALANPVLMNPGTSLALAMCMIMLRCLGESARFALPGSESKAGRTGVAVRRDID